MSIIAIIPARAGSKRLPGKNLLELGGRPLIAYSILLARSIPEIDRVVVVSDGEDILAAGQAYGAEICRLPAHLADGAHMLETVQYALAANSFLAEWGALLQPTSPLRLVDQCRVWIQQVLANPEADGLLTVDVGAYKLGIKDLGGYYQPEYQPGAEKQQMPQRLRENGLFYLLKADNIRRSELFGPRMLPRTCRREASLANIDYQFDFDFTCWAYEKYGYKAEFDRMEATLGQHP